MCSGKNRLRSEASPFDSTHLGSSKGAYDSPLEGSSARCGVDTRKQWGALVLSALETHQLEGLRLPKAANLYLS